MYWLHNTSGAGEMEIKDPLSDAGGCQRLCLLKRRRAQGGAAEAARCARAAGGARKGFALGCIGIL